MKGNAHRSFVPLIWLVGYLCSACHAGVEHIAATQMTVRIYAAQAVQERMAQLHLSSYRDEGGKFKLRAEKSYDKRGLGDVVDLVLAPRDSGEGTMLVVVDAVDKDGQVLVQARATFEFLAQQQRTIELWLYPCGLKQLGELCSDADCQGDACLTCVDDRCAPTPFYGPKDLLPFDPVVAAPAKPPIWLEDADAGTGLDACADNACATTPDDAGPKPPPDAGMDAGDAATPSDAAVDAGRDAGGGTSPLDAGFDGGTTTLKDAGVDAGTDAGFDAGFDAGTDAGTDAGRDTGTDTGTDTGPPPLETPGRCAAWTTAAPFGAVPPMARLLAEHMTSDRGLLRQYMCRVTTPDGSLTPGKVSQNPTNASLLDYTCYAAYLDSGSASWREFGDESSNFQVLTPPSECVLQWVSVPANGALPARALPIGNSPGGAPLYSCRITVNLTSGGVTRSGTHMGRVSATIGEACHVQYYSGVQQNAAYEVLVQTAP